MAQLQKAAAGVAGENPILQRARNMAVGLAERASEVDRTREISPETVRELHQAGLLTMGIPQSLGGTEVDLLTQSEVYEMIGGACASTAWCLANHISTCNRIQWMLGEASDPFMQQVVQDGAVMAHAQVPAGVTSAAPGGYTLSGRWPFVSFSNHARWIFLSTMVAGPPPVWQPKDGVSEPPRSHNRWLGVDPTDPKVSIEPTWKAMALRGSMSNDVVTGEVFVPEALAALGTRPAPVQPWLTNPPRALRVPSRARVWMPSLMLGIAQTALNEAIEYATVKPMYIGGQPGGSKRGSMPGNQFAVADAMMLIQSARAYLRQEIGKIMVKSSSGEAFSADDIAGIQMADLVARQNSQRAVDCLFAIQGAHGLLESADFERHYRDVRVGTLHAASTPDLIRELAGKHLLGIPEDVQPRWG